MYLICIYYKYPIYPPEVYQFAPEKLPKPKRKGSSSNHPIFRGKLAVKFRGCTLNLKCEGTTFIGKNRTIDCLGVSAA